MVPCEVLEMAARPPTIQRISASILRAVMQGGPPSLRSVVLAVMATIALVVSDQYAHEDEGPRPCTRQRRRHIDPPEAKGQALALWKEGCRALGAGCPLPPRAPATGLRGTEFYLTDWTWKEGPDGAIAAAIVRW